MHAKVGRYWSSCLTIFTLVTTSISGKFGDIVVHACLKLAPVPARAQAMPPVPVITLPKTTQVLIYLSNWEDGGFSKLGIPIRRIIVFLGLHWGPFHKNSSVRVLELVGL